MSKDKQRQNGLEPTSEAAGRHGSADRPASWSRRRLGVAALSTSVIVGLQSRPLRAAGVGGNCTISGWVSGNVSLHGEAQACGGRTPGAWQGGSPPEHRDSWAHITIGALFGTHYYVAESGENSTLREANLLDAVSKNVKFNDLERFQHERQLIRFGTAAWLNARYLDYPLKPHAVVDIVKETLENGGEYKPHLGETLTAEEVKNFLENTMDGPDYLV